MRGRILPPFRSLILLLSQFQSGASADAGTADWFIIHDGKTVFHDPFPALFADAGRTYSGHGGKNLPGFSHPDQLLFRHFQYLTYRLIPYSDTILFFFFTQAIPRVETDKVLHGFKIKCINENPETFTCLPGKKGKPELSIVPEDKVPLSKGTSRYVLHSIYGTGVVLNNGNQFLVSGSSRVQTFHGPESHPVSHGKAGTAVSMERYYFVETWNHPGPPIHD
jgi:hypothetical protein